MNRDDQLDRLLGQARWPEVTTESQRRIERHWQRLCRPKHPGRWLSAAAAAILIAFTTWLLLGNFQRPENGTAGLAIPTPSTTPSERTDPVRHETLSDADVLRIALKEADAASLFSFTPALHDHVSQAIDRLIADTGLDPAAEARTLLADANLRSVERSIIRNLQSSQTARKNAAARLLSAIGTQRAVPALLSLAKDPDTRPAAMGGLIRLCGPRTLAKRAMDEPDPLTRRQLITQILRGNPRHVVPVYLKLVGHEHTSQAAMEALSDTPDPPVDEFFKYLRHSRQDVRMAAARVLGRLNRPEVLSRLTRMIERDVNRRTAIAALLSSDGEKAREVLAAAEAHPALAGTVQSVRSELATKGI